MPSILNPSIQRLIQELRDNGIWPAIAPLGMGASARVYRTTNQSIPTGAFTAISFDAERWDDAAFWTSGSPTRLTIPAAGRYQVGASISFASGAGTLRYLALFVNGGFRIAQNQAPVTADEASIAVQALWSFAAGDYIEAIVFQNSGGALNVNILGNYSPEAWIQRVG